MIKKIISTLLAGLLLIPTAFCQEESQDFLRSTGKIYVVVAVIAVIFFSIVAFLVYLDRRISRLEKSAENDIKTS